MSSIEIFIIVISLLATFCGMVMMFACLASKRVQLVKAYNLQLEMEQAEADRPLEEDLDRDGEEIKNATGLEPN